MGAFGVLWQSCDAKGGEKNVNNLIFLKFLLCLRRICDFRLSKVEGNNKKYHNYRVQGYIMKNFYNEVEGKQLKKLPLNVAVYIRINSKDDKYWLPIYKKHINNYIAETNWCVTASYIDLGRSGLYMSESNKIMDLMQDIKDMKDLKELRFDPDFFIPYDMVVVFNIEQIATLEMDKDWYFESSFPTFFIDSETLASVDPEVSIEELKERAKINSDEENDYE